MKKIFIIIPIILLLVSFYLFFIVDFSLAAEEPGYEIEVSIPGGPTAGTPVTLVSYIKYIYIFGLSLIGIVALGTLVYGGFLYMMSDTVTSKDDAKKYIWAAISGLLLGLSAYLILNTINPSLTSLTPAEMPTPKPPVEESIPTDCTTDETACNGCQYCGLTEKGDKKVCKDKTAPDCKECKDGEFVQKEDGSKCSKYSLGTCKNGVCVGPECKAEKWSGCLFKDECCSGVCLYNQCTDPWEVPGPGCSTTGCLVDSTKCCGATTCIDMECK